MATNNYIRVRRNLDTKVFFFDDTNVESAADSQRQAALFGADFKTGGRPSFSVFRRTPLLPYLEIGEPTPSPVKLASVA